MTYTIDEVSRIARIAGNLALLHPSKKITSVDKSNVLATSRLWKKTVTSVIASEFPSITLEHQLVDSCAMILIKNPKSLNGIILTSNMFGDILSDEASVIPGSLGLLPSASLSSCVSGKLNKGISRS